MIELKYSDLMGKSKTPGRCGFPLANLHNGLILDYRACSHSFLSITVYCRLRIQIALLTRLSLEDAMNLLGVST